jgi:hypothetical protein
MDTLNECLIIGLICMICCHYLFVILNNKNSKKKNYYRQCLILCFLFGCLLHYIIKENNIDDLYCRKVCYNDECFMVCPIKNN